MARKTREQKAAEKARKQQLRALAAAATTAWIMGGDSDDLIALAIQAATVAASGEISPNQARALAETFTHLADQMLEVAERGDPEPNP